MRRLRVEQGLTIEALAIDVAVGLSWLAKLETGKQNPGVDVVDRLAARLGVDPVMLYSVPPDGPPPPPLRAGRKPKSR